MAPTTKSASLVRSVVAHRAPQPRVARLQSVQHGGEGRGVCDRSHGSVWTSTEDTLGKYSAIASHVSPASADAYTCPPVVPK